MEKYTSPEQTLTEIKHLMERSSRFISLSGLSGVLAGIYALAGAAVAYFYLQGTDLQETNPTLNHAATFLVTVAVIVLVLAVGTGVLLTTRKARKDGNSLLDVAAKKLVANLCIPLFAGGVFCLTLLYRGDWSYLVPAMLTFYGLALLNAGKYTRDDVRSLGIAQITLGLISLLLPAYALVFWSLGFGLLHIVYGTRMYYKYEK